MNNPKLLLLLVILFGITFSSCNDKRKKSVAVLKFATHPALDELENSFTATLDSLIKADKELQDYVIDPYNADGNPQNAKSIAESFNISKPELILVIGTPAAMQVSNTPSKIPFIYGAVADPKGAKIIPSDRATGIQNAGENIIVEALSFMRKAFPNAKKLGTIYNPGEQNSKFVQTFIEKHSKEFGFELKQVTITEASQITGTMDFLSNQVDIIYSANDNTINSGIASAIAICDKKKIPFVIGDLSTLSKGPLFAIGLEYKSMGKSLAKMAYKILKGTAINQIPPQSAPQPEVWFNRQTKSKIDYQLPQGLDSFVHKNLN